jgi:hypothetical protein
MVDIRTLSKIAFYGFQSRRRRLSRCRAKPAQETAAVGPFIAYVEALAARRLVVCSPAVQHSEARRSGGLAHPVQRRAKLPGGGEGSSTAILPAGTLLQPGSPRSGAFVPLWRAASKQ